MLSTILSNIAIALYLLATAGVLFVAYHAIWTQPAVVLMLIGMGCFLELRGLLVQWIVDDRH